jgi:hypothetical protein
MRELILEYVLEGQQRGYNFTSPTKGFHDDTLKSIWRSAMPRGQGWGAYVGARALKIFALEDGRAALSEVIVTDLRDESGRGGIRRAVIQVMQPGALVEVLGIRLAHYPADVQAVIAKRPTLGQSARILERAMPKMRNYPQLILSHPYANPTDWQTVEALALKLALSPLLLKWRRDQLVPITTLALDYRDESAVVLLPADKAKTIAKVPVIDLGL